MQRVKSSDINALLALDAESIAAREKNLSKDTDEVLSKRIQDKFTVLDSMTLAVCRGDVRGMIVSGPPGVGKSFGVERQLDKHDLFNKMTSLKPRFEVVKGSISALGLYAKLYEYSRPGNVVVFDDCDIIFSDEDSLNILKSALDSGEKRYINWNKDSRMLRQDGIPNRYEFKGSGIFITNLQFEHVRSKRLKDHLAALESRCHIINLGMSTVREKILRIRQVVDEGMLDEKLEPEAKDEVVSFVSQNAHMMRELSLRMVLKVSDLRKAFPHSWMEMASETCMKK